MLDRLQHGRDCYAHRRWSEAHQSFASTDRTTPLAVDDLERFATTAYLAGRDLEFQQLHDRLHRAHLDAGDKPRAARCAFWLCLSLLLRGETAQANGWAVRGQRLVDGLDCVEQGYLLSHTSEQQLREGQAEAAYTTAATAAAIGERFGDRDLVAAARHMQGRALIEQGRISAGLGFLDETMLAVVGGELSPIMTGLMYCSVIDACQQVYAFSRAREWTFALSRVCEQQPEMVAFHGPCLVHRAEILQFNGAWRDAMAEACRACELARRVDRQPPAAAFYQQAEIHRLRGEFAEAEEAFRRVSGRGREPQPGLALLRLAQGRTDAAAAAIRRVVAATSDRAQRARLLPAYVEIMMATGDMEEARRACHELQALAETFETDALRAVAAHWRGALEVCEGNARAALGPLRAAFETWGRLEAPYEAARARVLMGLACRALGDEEAAALELGAAKAAFERLGALPDLARLDRLATLDRPGDDHPLTARERHVLRLIAAGSTNKAIAAELGLSERTIDRHVSNILNKLNVPSRAAATAYAYDHKLL